MSGDESIQDPERIDIPRELRGEVMVYQPMVVAEISLGGAQIETKFPLLVDSLHDFRLMLGERSVVVKGRIVHAHVCDMEEGTAIYRAGIEFVQPSEHVREAIEEFLKLLMTAGA